MERRASVLLAVSLRFAEVDVGAFESKLDDYLSGVDVEAVAELIADSLGIELEVASNHLATHVGEARVAMRFVGPAIEPGLRVLEVGSGIGLFAGFLRSIHIDVTELEPVGMGFQFIGAARAALSDYTRPSSHLDIGVEALQPTQHGTYDLIFSINVLEHVADWRIALGACRSVLSKDGHMLHVHPNYAVPYEPHFNVPLVPFRPALTAHLLPKRISDTDVWRSLNWVTAGQVRRWCRSHGLEIDFRPAVLAEMVDRVTTDPLFKQRHSGVVQHAATLVTRLRLGWLLRRLPATLSTPLEYSARWSR